MIFLIISLATLPAKGMCCNFKKIFQKISLKIRPIDEIPDEHAVQTQEFERRLAVIVAENKRQDKLQEQDQDPLTYIEQDPLYRREHNEHNQLIKEAAQRAKQRAELARQQEKQRLAAINEKHDLKMLDEISKVFRDKPHLIPFEKAVELSYYAKFISSEELKTDIKTQANELYSPTMPKLEI
jgi:hypothetical protein